jgi:hypothetical protein
MNTTTDSIWTDDLIQKLRDDWASGYSTVEIGRRLGCGKNACVGKARRIGLDQRQNVVRTIGQEKTEAAQKLINIGTPTAEIAETVGIHVDTVRALRKRMGVAGPAYTRQSRDAPRFVVEAHGPTVLTLFSETISAPAPSPVIVRHEPHPTPVITTTRTCEFIAGEGRPWTPCGDPVVARTSYCQSHGALCFVRERRERSPA